MNDKVIEFFKRHGEMAALLFLLLFAFCVRMYFLLNYRYPLMLHEQDGIAYMQIADDILHFRPLRATFMPPFYPFVIAAFSIFPVSAEMAARLASIAMDALVVLPLYGLGKRLLNPPVAFCTCALWACFSLSLFSSPSPMAFSSYLFTLLTGMYLLYRVLYEQWHPSVIFMAGACMAFAYLTRPEGIVGFACGLILCLFFLAWRRERQAARLVLLYVVGFCIFAAPYWVFLHNDLGYWTFSGKTSIAITGVDNAMVLKNGTLPTKTAGGMSLWLEKTGGVAGAAEFVFKNAVGFIATLRHFSPSWMNWLALFGFGCLFIGKEAWKRLILLIPLLVTVPACIATLPKTPGYIYPLFTMFFLSLSWGGDRIIRTMGKGIERSGIRLHPLGPKAVVGACAVALIALFGFDSFRKAAYEFQSPGIIQQVELARVFEESGQIVKAMSTPADPVMTRWGLISYFADRPYMSLPKGNVAEVIEYGRRKGARFLVIDTKSVQTRRQELDELLNPLRGMGIDPSYGIRLIRMNAYDGVGGYVVYRYGM